MNRALKNNNQGYNSRRYVEGDELSLDNNVHPQQQNRKRQHQYVDDDYESDEEYDRRTARRSKPRGDVDNNSVDDDDVINPRSLNNNNLKRVGGRSSSNNMYNDGYDNDDDVDVIKKNPRNTTSNGSGINNNKQERIKRMQKLNIDEEENDDEESYVLSEFLKSAEFLKNNSVKEVEGSTFDVVEDIYGLDENKKRTYDIRYYSEPQRETLKINRGILAKTVFKILKYIFDEKNGDAVNRFTHFTMIKMVKEDLKNSLGVTDEKYTPDHIDEYLFCFERILPILRCGESTYSEVVFLFEHRNVFHAAEISVGSYFKNLILKDVDNKENRILFTFKNKQESNLFISTFVTVSDTKDNKFKVANQYGGTCKTFLNDLLMRSHNMMVERLAQSDNAKVKTMLRQKPSIRVGDVFIKRVTGFGKANHTNRMILSYQDNKVVATLDNNVNGLYYFLVNFIKPVLKYDQDENCFYSRLMCYSNVGIYLGDNKM